MSLVGSLEDLGLGDILQIIHLSGKSGVLVLRAGQGEAEVLFSNGLVRGAFTKGGPTSLAELLVAREAAPADVVADAAEDAQHRGGDLVSILAERGVVDADTVDTLRRDHIASCVIEMFGWPTGEFSFEIREIPLDSDSDGFFSTPGLNPQFIALEGTRRLDEGTFDDGEEDDAGDGDVRDPGEGAHIIAAATAAAEAPADDVLELPALSESDLVAPDDSRLAEPSEGVVALADAPPESAAEAPAEVASAAETIAATESASQRPALESPPASAPRPQANPPVILVDPELPVLEWAKAALGDAFPQVHIFQSTDLAIARIRQYLARTRVPLVVLASDVPPDSVSGAAGPYELFRRLRRQSARMSVAVLAPRSHRIQAPTDAAPDVVVRKPTLEDLSEARGRAECERLAAELVQDLVTAAQRAGMETSERLQDAASLAGSGETPAADISRLRESSSRIRHGAAHGEVLPQVLEFAGQAFERVALFMVRDDRALGIAETGLSRAGGPDEVALRELHIGAREPSWFRTVLDTKQPHRGSAVDEGDQRLAVMLGNEIPSEVYVAPIQTGDGVIALVYADNLPSRAPLGDTAAFEVLLDSAGIALERSLLERELAAFDG